MLAPILRFDPAEPVTQQQWHALYISNLGKVSRQKVVEKCSYRAYALPRSAGINNYWDALRAGSIVSENNLSYYARCSWVSPFLSDLLSSCFGTERRGGSLFLLDKGAYRRIEEAHTSFFRASRI